MSVKKNDEAVDIEQKGEQPVDVLKPKEPPVEAPKKNIIKLREDGSLNLTDHTDALQFASMLVQKNMAPRNFKDGYQVIAAFQAGAELGLSPYASLSCFAMINGNPSLHTDGPKALVDASGFLTYFEEWFFDKDGKIIEAKDGKVNLAKPFGSYCKMKRKGVTGFKDHWYSLEDATDAGLFMEPSKRTAERKGKKKPWDLYTPIMLQRRARAFVMKTLFADVLKGVKIAEYDFHSLPEKNSMDVDTVKEKDVTPVAGASALNEDVGVS